jgi:hypothetical protein
MGDIPGERKRRSRPENGALAPLAHGAAAGFARGLLARMSRRCARLSELTGRPAARALRQLQTRLLNVVPISERQRAPHKTAGAAGTRARPGSALSEWGAPS